VTLKFDVKTCSLSGDPRTQAISNLRPFYPRKCPPISLSRVFISTPIYVYGSAF